VSKSWEPYAQHIKSAIEKIRRIQARGDFTNDDILYDAVLRNLQTLSEATQQLPGNLKALHPEIPWRDISGFRNILVHNDLGQIDAQAVNKVVSQNLGPLESSGKVMLGTDG
jgi:uncharacterized protein with HEPN domain